MLHQNIIIYLEDKKVDKDDVDDNVNEDEKHNDNDNKKNNHYSSNGDNITAINEVDKEDKNDTSGGKNVYNNGKWKQETVGDNASMTAQCL
jgi:hypothetical protein